MTNVNYPKVGFCCWSVIRNGVKNWDQVDLIDLLIANLSPCSPQEIQASREDKYRSVCKAVDKENRYLREHPRAKIDVALCKIKKRCEQLKSSDWVLLCAQGREIGLSEDPEALAEVDKLDGCYVLRTDLSEAMATKEVVHDRYKDLALVEWAFRSTKTVQLEVRPVYVRLATRIRGHVFVIIMAYQIIKEPASC